MAIDITDTKAMRKLTLGNLVDDAVERKDREALQWLQEQALAVDTRKKKDGTEFEVPRSIIVIRSQYVRKFLGYVPAGKDSREAKARMNERRKAAKVKRIEQRKAMFTDAFEKI